MLNYDLVRLVKYRFTFFITYVDSYSYLCFSIVTVFFNIECYILKTRIK